MNRRNIAYGALCVAAVIALVIAIIFSEMRNTEKTITQSSYEEKRLDFSGMDVGDGNIALVLRSDVGLELKVRDMELDSWESIEELLISIKEKYPDYIPVMAGYDKSVIEFPADVDNSVLYDGLGNMIGILEDPSASSTVTNYFATDSFREMCERIYKWRIKGLVDKNELISTTALVKEEYSAGFFCPYYEELTLQATECCGVAMSVYPIFTGISQKGNDNAEKDLIAAGFEFDDSDVITEEAACEEVISVYRDAPLNGRIKPESGIKDFNNALIDAGIDKVIASKQRQIRRYLRG